MATLNFSTASLKGINSTFATALTNLDKMTQFANDKEGAYGFIVKYWDVKKVNKTTGEKATLMSYHEIANGLGIAKPKDFRRIAFDLLEGKGLHPLMLAEKKNSKGEISLVTGLWGSKSLENADVTIIDAKGKETHPNIKELDAKGKKVAVKVDAIRPIGKSVTADSLFRLVIQNMACEQGQTPYTADNFYEDFDVIEDANGDYMATAKQTATAPTTAPTCPLTAKTPTTSMTA